MTQRRYLLAVAFITAIGAAIRFATLGRQSYWSDELYTVALLHGSFGHALAEVPRSEATPYVYYVLAWAWRRLFGLGEFGLRSLSALFGAATVPVAYGAGAALANRRVGLIAATLVCVSPFLVWYSQEARAYSLLAFFCALTLLFFGRASLRDSPRALWWWGLSAALALATHYFAIVVVVPEALLLLALCRRRRFVIGASVLPAAVQCAQIPLILTQRGNASSVSQSPLARRSAGAIKNLAVGYSFPAELTGSIAAAALIALGVVLLVRSGRAEHRGGLLAGAAAVAALGITAVSAVAGIDFLLARNLIAVVVPAAVCLAAGYGANRFGLGAAAALVALFLAISLSVTLDSRYGRTDWRGAGRVLGPADVRRAIVVTPPMPGSLWQPYVRNAGVVHAARVRVTEIDVVALATEGAFSSRALTPPPLRPRAAPAGFGVVLTKRTSTFAFVRYRAATPTIVPFDVLERLGLSPTVLAGVLFQRPQR